MRSFVICLTFFFSGFLLASPCMPASEVDELTASLHEQSQAILMQGAYINHFNRLCPQEKVYLHFDNTAYFQGETIWFSATVVKATDGTVADSKVLYVELLSPPVWCFASRSSRWRMGAATVHCPSSMPR